jgi:peptide/nickel transport system substrate-binding protein
MWARIGVKANLVSQSKSIHFPLIAKQPPETEFYMLGWGVPTYDSAYILDFLYHTRGGPYGGFNGSGYSRPALDEKIKAISATVDIPKRNATIAEIWKDVSQDSPYIPVHHQMVAHAMKKSLNVRVHPDNGVYWKTIDVK